MYSRFSPWCVHIFHHLFLFVKWPGAFVHLPETKIFHLGLAKERPFNIIFNSVLL